MVNDHRGNYWKGMEVIQGFHSQYNGVSCSVNAVSDKGTHPASHVTLLMSGGKFASGADFSGGRFLSFRGALFYLQGGAYFF